MSEEDKHNAAFTSSCIQHSVKCIFFFPSSMSTKQVSQKQLKARKQLMHEKDNKRAWTGGETRERSRSPGSCSSCPRWTSRQEEQDELGTRERKLKRESTHDMIH